MWILTVPVIAGAILLSTPPSPAPSTAPRSESREYFKEDHYTGADYLALDGSGSYELIGREHMGVWVLQRGTWRRDGDTYNFVPAEPKDKKAYSGLRIQHEGHAFFVWSSDEAPGMVVPADNVKRDLSNKEGMPPYVFFCISDKVFRAETDKTYPFKFYPELNAR